MPTFNTGVFGTSYSLISGDNYQQVRNVAFMLNKTAHRQLRTLMKALNGVAPGASATSSYRRVAANSNPGGSRVVETFTEVNRVTTAADVTNFNTNVFAFPRSVGASAKVNLDGNPRKNLGG